MSAENIILQTVSYFNLFDHPLRGKEITALLALSRETCADALSKMVESRVIGTSEEFFFIPGRSYIIDRRRESEELFGRNIGSIRRAGWLISHFPFVRGIILTGSAAKGMLDPYDDFDFFIFAENGRLWICKTIINIFRLLVSFNYRNRLHKYFCCNSFLSVEHLAIPDRNRFTALEIAFAKPIFNRPLHARFLSENPWIEEYFSIDGGYGRLAPVSWRADLIQRTAECALEIVSKLFFRGRLDDRIRERYHAFWLRKNYVPDRAAIVARSSEHWIRAECGNKKEFLMRHFDRHDGSEFNCSLRTRINLKRRSAPAGAPDILLTHSFLINLTRTEKKVMRPYVPQGPLYIAAYLREKGYRAGFFDPIFDRNTRRFARFMRSSGIAVVGIYATELCRKNAAAMIRIARENGAGVIMGGPDPSADPRYYVERGADCVVVGEGEETMNALMGALINGDRDVYSIPGVYTARGMTARGAYPANLDDLPFPARELADIENYFNKTRERHGFTSLMVTSSRGCPHECAWCSKAVSGRFLRQRSAGNFVDELVHIKETYAPDHVWVTDDNFAVDAQWMDSFHREVTRRGAAIPYECFARANSLDDRTLEKMRDSGCLRVWYGAESGSQKVLDRMNKGITVADIAAGVERTRRHGIESGLNIMLAYPGEEIGDIDATRALLRETRPEELIVKYSFPLKRTRFHDEVSDRLLRWRREEPRDNNLWLSYKARYSGWFYLIVKLLFMKEHRVLARKRVRWTDRALLAAYDVLYQACKIYYLYARPREPERAAGVTAQGTGR